MDLYLFVLKAVWPLIVAGLVIPCVAAPVAAGLCALYEWAKGGRR
jgi:hypothetical protein